MLGLDLGAIRTPRALAALAYNLVPVAGVMLWGWDAFALIFLYWLENVAIGIRTFLSILANGVSGGVANAGGALFMAAFFAVHYGIFCSVHGMFVLLLFGEGRGDDLLGVVRAMLGGGDHFTVGIAGILVWQAVELALFMGRGQYKDETVQEIMFSPYPRIVVLHVTIIFSGFALLLLGAPQAGVILLAIFKTAADVILAARSEQLAQTGRL
ncbi:MAG: DUF6498-containing protein [Caulobacterales bacterium]